MTRTIAAAIFALLAVTAPTHAAVIDLIDAVNLNYCSDSPPKPREASSPGSQDVAPENAEPRGRGRPLGARNRHTNEVVNFYIGQNDGRHPLARGIEIAGLPILAKGVLEGLAERLGMSRADAAKWWAGILSATLPYVAPYVAQRQAALEVRNPGAPGSGRPILWTLTEEGELVDDSHDGSKLRAITSSG